MILREKAWGSRVMHHADMTFQLAVLKDASAQADRYWCNWLWHREQPSFEPSHDVFEALGEYERVAVAAAWKNWFRVLTSWEFADALIGCDVRHLLAGSESLQETR